MKTLETTRIAALQKVLDSKGYDAFIASTSQSMGYLAGFHEHGFERLLIMVIPKSGEPYLVCPALSAVAAEAVGLTQYRTWRDGEDGAPLFAALAQELGLKRICVDDQMPAAYLLKLQQACPTVSFELGGEVLSELQCVKSDEQLAHMRYAAKIADEAQLKLQREVKVGMSENECATIIREYMTAHDCQPTFCIIAAGAGSAEPHHMTGEEKLSKGDVVIVDCGCLYKGYNSDTTRTFNMGKASADVHAIYDIVYRSHMAACEAIKVGTPCESIDKASRDVIEDAGYGEFYVHRTGHGIGMQIHEPPYIVGGSKQPLVVGQCFSVEPGIYLPGKFGIRIENIVTVTEQGFESLNGAPPEHMVEVEC